MSSEQLADGVNPLDAELAATWDVLKGYSGRDTDLGIARRFGGAAAAYSLRNIGSDGLPVIRVRRDSNDDEEDFSAAQIASGALETFVIDGATQKGLDQSTWQDTGAESFSSTSTDGFSFSNSSGTAFIGVTLSETLALNDSVFISFNASGVTHPASSNQSPQVRLRDSVSGGNGTSPINQVTNGFNAYELEYTTGSSGQHIVFSEGDTAGGTVTISDFKVFGVSRNGFVKTWYDQSGNGNDATQGTAANQPSIVQNGGLNSDGLLFDGSDDSFEAADITNVDFPATVVSVSETNLTGSPNRALYSLNNDSNSCSGFYRSTNKYAINNGTTTLEGSATYTVDVHRLKFDLFNGASSTGFSNSVLDISGDIGTQVSQVTHFRIGGSLKSGITTPHNGTIKEIILYTSDQTSDRNDIETDINNYYNIY